MSGPSTDSPTVEPVVVDLDALDTAARAASHGPWDAQVVLAGGIPTLSPGDDHFGVGRPGQVIALTGPTTGPHVAQARADTHYLTLCAPDRILSVTDRLRRAEHASAARYGAWRQAEEECAHRRQQLAETTASLASAQEALRSLAARFGACRSTTRSEAPHTTCLDGMTHRGDPELPETPASRPDGLAGASLCIGCAITHAATPFLATDAE